MADLEIRGVPGRLASDAWWLVDKKQGDGPARHDGSPKAVIPVAACTLACLVILADFLFWKHPVGISLIIFSAALTGASVFRLRPGMSAKDASLLALLWAASALPLVEYVQASSLLLMGLGHSAVLAFLATRASGGPLLRQALLLPLLMVRFAGAQLRGALRRPNLAAPTRLHRDAWLTWLLPGLVGLVFASLFLQANPLLQRWVAELSSPDLEPDTLLRVAFWAVAAMLLLPVARFNVFSPRLKQVSGLQPQMPNLEGRLLNARSVANGLVVFNALFMLQNITDIAVLWAGASLPEGMTYAAYAHQGAYPLMATSALAGVFVIAAQRFVGGSPVLRALLLLWVLQNVLLAMSALGRLDLYMYAYGLTYLRLRAAIGMGLVIAGMALLGWQIWQRKPPYWTAKRFACLVLATVYFGSFVNFGHVIASYNLERDAGRIDRAYICQIGSLAAKALSDANMDTCGFAQNALAPKGWRDWGWRKARLHGYGPITVLSARDISQPNS